MNRHWSIAPEAPDEDRPTGRFFVMPNRITGRCSLTGEMEYEPDHTADALGPYDGITKAARVQGLKNYHERRGQ